MTVEASRRYRARHPEKVKQVNREYRARNLAKERERGRIYWRGKNKYPAPTRTAPATCEICDQTGGRELHLDHDHESGAFRGWLCFRCNSAIGLFMDSPDLLTRAAQYLKANAQ